MATTTTSNIEQLAINTIRTLSMDAVQQANSGHPGTPMALAPVAYVIFNEAMNFDPASPYWPNRDRFVLSCGHASMLLYSMLYLTGVQHRGKCQKPDDERAVSLDEVRKFRQLHHRTPGHPEYGETTGVETTTGPLGQGVANSVGMAIAQRWLAAHFNKPGYDLFDYDVFAVCSDGDLMEGISGEAASLAGHLGLGNLCWVYDDNGITIDGTTSLAFSEDVATRFRGYRWNVVEVDDANELDALRAAVETAKQTDDRPTLVIVRSVIGWGAPKLAGTSKAHGAPLGEEEIRGTKEAYGWPDEAFHVPEGVTAHFAEGIGRRGSAASAAWYEMFEQYKKDFPELAATVHKMTHRELPDGWDAELPEFPADAKGMASRASSAKVINAVAEKIPWFLGGSADLAESNKTTLKFADVGSFTATEHGGRNLHFGIREHAMAAAANGLALCGLRPFAATFFVFTDYMRPSMRLASLMGLPVLYVLTHDSIGVGEDGPTHQPVEHLAACRSIPGLHVFRPGDANEVTESYRAALSLARNPSCLVLTRQNIPTLDRTKFAAASGVARGGYVLADAAPTSGENAGVPEVILIGTGSELTLCVEAYEQLVADGVKARLVSMPCFELFESQDEAYRNEVLPPTCTHRVACEAGVRQGWDAYIGRCGAFIGMNGFGASGPAKELFAHFGITTEAIRDAVKAMLASGSGGCHPKD